MPYIEILGGKNTSELVENPDAMQLVMNLAAYSMQKTWGAEGNSAVSTDSSLDTLRVMMVKRIDRNGPGIHYEPGRYNLFFGYGRKGAEPGEWLERAMSFDLGLHTVQQPDGAMATTEALRGSDLNRESAIYSPDPSAVLAAKSIMRAVELDAESERPKEAI